MSAETVGPVHPAAPPVTAPHEVIHLGGQAAVIVPSPSSFACEPWRAPRPHRRSKTPRTPPPPRTGSPEKPAARRTTSHSPRSAAASASPTEPPAEPQTALAHVSRQVSLDEKAIHQATAFLADDPDGLHAVLAAIEALSENPYPDDAVPFGSTGLHRPRVGRYRVLYAVTEDLISVGHIARAPADR